MQTSYRAWAEENLNSQGKHIIILHTAGFKLQWPIKSIGTVLELCEFPLSWKPCRSEVLTRGWGYFGYLWASSKCTLQVMVSAPIVSISLEELYLSSLVEALGV